MKYLTKTKKRMAIIAGMALVLAGNLFVFTAVKSNGSDLLRFGVKLEAMAQGEDDWEGQRLKTVNCTCPGGKPRGISLRCSSIGDLESCTSSQQGSNACYKVGLFGIDMLCEGSGITFED